MKRTVEQTFTRKVLSSKGFLQANKHIAKMCGLHASIMLAELIWQEELAQQHDRLSTDGFFHVYRKTLEEETTLSSKLQRSAEDMLIAHKMLERRINSTKTEVLFRLNHDKIRKALEN